MLRNGHETVKKNSWNIHAHGHANGHERWTPKRRNVRDGTQ
jgi:hypothetical protein